MKFLLLDGESSIIFFFHGEWHKEVIDLKPQDTMKMHHKCERSSKIMLMVMLEV